MYVCVYIYIYIYIYTLSDTTVPQQEPENKPACADDQTDMYVNVY